MSGVSLPKISVGADPEVFVLKGKGGRSIISAHDLLPGTKAKPYKVHLGAIQVDGVAAEFNIDPCYNSESFTNTIKSVMETLQHMLPENAIKIQASHKFPKEYLDSLPVETRLLGCNPDYNAWTGRINPIPNGNATTLRTASGHLHIGWTKNEDIDDPIHFSDCCRLAKQLDYYVGLATLLWDTDSRRRELYGKAGAFRPKPYGIEYRTPSNMWLRHPSVYSWLWHSCYYATLSLIQGKVFFPDEYGNLAEQVINNNQTAFVTTSDYKAMLMKMGLGKPTW